VLKCGASKGPALSHKCLRLHLGSQVLSLFLGGSLKKLAIVVVTILALGLGTTPAKAIVFGEDVLSASTQYPWVASIWFAGPNDDYYQPMCTGSLIAPDVVLTAAHCLFNYGTYYVQMGSDIIDGENDSTFYEVDAVWKNPRYSKRTLVNDIGLLKLTTPQFQVAPMPFATKRDLAAVRKSKNMEILGWGQNQSGERATYLRYTKVTEQLRAARSLYPAKNFNQNTMLAAGRYIKRERVYTGACYGDSGGPLLATIKGVKKVIGITSWGKRGCNTKAPTVFTNVAYYERDIAKGIATLQRSALVDNRAMPSIVSEPSIQAGAGSLTCSAGSWSSNTTKVEIVWTAPYSIWRSTNPTVTLPTRNFLDTKYTCVVTGSNRNGKITRELSVTVPVSPTASTSPRIEEVGWSVHPTLDQTLNCSPPTYRTSGVSNAFAWYASSATSLDPTSATLLGEGSSLVMSETVEAAMAGKTNLFCMVTGSNLGGTIRLATYVGVTLPFKR
jgi:secreted trypsin-like serine protease